MKKVLDLLERSSKCCQTMNTARTMIQTFEFGNWTSNLLQISNSVEESK